MDLALTLDPHADSPLHQQLYEELRRAILQGRLPPRQRIPSTRGLAKLLGISRTTVVQSYDRLLSEGYLQTTVGSGTYICEQLPDDLLYAQPVSLQRSEVHPPIVLSTYGDRLAKMPFALQSEPQTSINFRYGRPALRHFPITIWRRLLARHCRGESDWLDYAVDMQGDEQLRYEIARYLARARAVQCEPSQIVITNGTQQALDLVMRLLVEPGARIAMEDPGYLNARRIFLSHGANLLPVGVDEAGLKVGELTQQPPSSIRLVYVTPSHQFPTGAILSLPRRLELLAWAQQSGALILEDDYDSEYRYGDRPIPSLQGLETGESVLYIGTFSKMLFPSLRIGYVVAPTALAPVFAQAKWLSDRHLPVLEQRVLTDFIEEGHLEHHIRKMRSHYDRCRQTLVHSLKAQFDQKAEILGEKAGMHVMVRLHTPFRDEEIIARAAKVGVGLISAAPHYLNPNCSGEFIFGYGELDEAQIEAGVERLARGL